MNQIFRLATRTLLPLLMVAASPLAHAERSYTCSLWTLQGTYTTVITGQLTTPGGLVPISGVAISYYDGAGNITTNIDHIVIGGVQPPVAWRGGSGTYKVNADCTSESHITFEGGGPPLHVYSVIARYGATTRGVVAASNANITFESTRLEDK